MVRDHPQDELELHDYLDVAARHLGLIVVALLAALGIGVVYTLLQPQKYEAVALLLVSRQTPQQPSFDPRFPSPDIQTASKAIAVLMRSPGVAAKVGQEVGKRVAPGTPVVLDDVVIEVLRDDSSLVRVAARHSDPQVAAAIANTWADVGARDVSEMYSQSGRALKLVDGQLKAAEDELRRIGSELREFHGRSRMALLQSKVNQGNAYLAQLVAAQQRIALTLTDAQRVRAQLAAGADGTIADALLQLLILDWTVPRGAMQPAVTVPGARPAEGAQMIVTSPPPAPVQLQVAVERLRLTERPLAERLRDLDTFVAALEAERTALDRQIAQETAAVQEARRDLAVEMAEEERLNLAFEAARRTYTTLSNKADELRIAVQSDVLPAQVASPAAVPDAPAPRPWLLHLGVAAAVGIFVGLAGAFAFEQLAAAQRQQRATHELVVTKEGRG